MKMINYGKYKNVRNAAWQVLIDYKINKLPVKVTNIVKQANIKLLNNSDCNFLKNNQLGVSIYIENEWYIIVDDTMKIERIRFTIAHELGHIFLGHESLLHRTPNSIFIEKPEEETEADMFAARLLAPACVLWGLNLRTPEEIAKICNISYQAAVYRAKRMEILYKRNMFLTSDLEKQVYSNFSEFIKNHKKEE